MQLVDTSVWVEIFRRPPLLTLDDIAVEHEQIVTCLPVIQEVLQGFDDERLFSIARTAMYATTCLEMPVTSATIDRAIEIYRRARRQGVTLRSSVDCLIAACALPHGATVVHADRDYANIARVTALQQRDLSTVLARRRKK